MMTIKPNRPLLYRVFFHSFGLDTEQATIRIDRGAPFEEWPFIR